MEYKQTFDQTLLEFDHMIHYLIHKLGIRDPEREFFQEGVIALWQATITYEHERGKFSSYAYFMIEKALLSLIRNKNHQMVKTAACLTSLAADSRNMIANLDIDLSIDAYLLESIKLKLTDKQWIWFVLHVLHDMSIKDIALSEQVSIDTVKNWARLAKPKLRELLLKERYVE